MQRVKKRASKQEVLSLLDPLIAALPEHREEPAQSVFTVLLVNHIGA